MGRKQAVAALRARLVSRFGDDAQDLVDQEITSMLRTRPRLQVQDLDQLQSTLAQALAPRPRPASLLPPYPKPLTSDLNRSIPLMAQLTPVTSGKRQLQGASPSALFPKLDGMTVNLEQTPLSRRDLSPLDLGLPEKQRFTDLHRHMKRWDPRKEDQWGRVLQWDAAKFQQEETARKQAKEQIKAWYREELNSQVKLKEQATATVLLEETATGLNFPSSRVDKSPALRLTPALDDLLTQQKEEIAQSRRQKEAEKKQLEDQLTRDKEVKAAKDQSRRCQLLTLKEHQMQTASERLQARKARQAASRARERQQLELDREFDADSLQKHSALKRGMVREVSEENRKWAFEGTRERRGGTSPRTGEIAERSKSEKRAQQQKAAAELEKQVQEQAQRTLAWRQLQQEQAALWAKEQTQDLAKLREQQTTRRELQKQLRVQLDSQVEEKAQRVQADSQFSQVEQQLNRELLQAVAGCK